MRHFRSFSVLVVVMFLAVGQLFALDAVKTELGGIFYGDVIVKDGQVTVDDQKGLTETFARDAVEVFPSISSPKPKPVAMQGNFEITQGAVVFPPIDMNKFRSSMRYALSLHRWVVTEEKPGELFCRLSKGTSWSVTIRICYTTTGYWYEYLDSEHLDANPKKNKIHRNYLRWIDILEREMIRIYR